MKKLSLKKLSLSTNDLLQREQLKSIFGGYDLCAGQPCHEGDTTKCGTQCICDFGRGYCRLH
ncbi:hypothetical protein [Winogradskyella sp.]|uniref:hypothetical protein n=1 Tax=Winogradskyella sp. TaxID=1883156 RepID=UPI0026334D98|nr:hypothetical protein [Winogradskyella sp.]